MLYITLDYRIKDYNYIVNMFAYYQCYVCNSRPYNSHSNPESQKRKGSDKFIIPFFYTEIN